MHAHRKDVISSFNRNRTRAQFLLHPWPAATQNLNRGQQLSAQFDVKFTLGLDRSIRGLSNFSTIRKTTTLVNGNVDEIWLNRSIDTLGIGKEQ